MVPRLLAAVIVLIVGGWLWSLHAGAWDLGGRSPVLGYDAAQYAVAARELAEHGRLATTFALPIELGRHPRPPWPLASVQPGLVVAEAVVDRVVPGGLHLPGHRLPLAQPSEREWLSLALPLASFLGIAMLLVVGIGALLARMAPESPPALRWAAGAVVAFAFLLDPEAQHFAAGGFTELPYTLGVMIALFLVAFGAAARRPLLFGLLLGVTGSFRANMLWFAPCVAIGVAALAPRGARARIAIAVLLGYALPLLPWWIYKWRQFGSPGSDLSRLMLWEGVEGRTWFTMLHLPEPPTLPTGLHAWTLIADKMWRNLGPLLLAVASGPRALWIGALAVWLLARPSRPLAVAGLLVLAQLGLSILAAAATIPWLRYVFPARIPLEAAGLLATWALVGRVPEQPLGASTRRLLRVGVGGLALAWGLWQCGLGLREARATSADRGLPSVATLTDLGQRLDRELTTDEPVMSNLGATLAYHARRPVLHLALAPEDLEACRARLTFTHVLLAFRGADRAWSEWQAAMTPGGELRHPEWNVARVRRWTSADGFSIVWLELGPPRPRLALGSSPASAHHGDAPHPARGARLDAHEVDAGRRRLRVPVERPAARAELARGTRPHLAPLDVVHVHRHA